jgi:hypothetical protein
MINAMIIIIVTVFVIATVVDVVVPITGTRIRKPYTV